METDSEIGGMEPENLEAATSDDELGVVPERTWAEWLVMIVAGIAAVLSVVEIVLEMTKQPVIVGGMLGLVVAPLVIYQQRSMTEIIAMKKTYAATVKEVARFKQENDRLGENVKELDGTVNRLEEMETALDVITQTQGQSLEEFEAQVVRNKQILHDMLKSLKANVRQNLLTVIYSSDIDGDGLINDNEVDALVQRIDKCNGVTLHEQNFREAISSNGGSLHSVLTLVKQMVTNDESSNDIFTVGEL